MNELTEIILNDFAEWLKTKPVYVCGKKGQKEVCIARDGVMLSAVETYLNEVQPKIITEVIEE